jgi:hypothetical protein
MPSYLASAQASRIRKPGSVAGLRRHASSPFAANSRTKPSIKRAQSLQDVVEQKGSDHEELPKEGAVLSVIQVATAVDVLSAMHHATTTMFSQIPERAGLNSVRIAEVLNFQRSMPPLVSLAHVHALISASSKTERQINSLVTQGAIRRIKIFNRGNDISGASDYLVATASFASLLTASSIDTETTATFLTLLSTHPHATTLSPTVLPPHTIPVLTRAGFLVSSSTTTRPTPNPTSTLSGSSLVSHASISRAHSGTQGAVGGSSAFEELGGVGHAPTTAKPPTSTTPAPLHITLPNAGAYIRLLTSARAHLRDLLQKSPYQSSPMSLLKERWDGSVDSVDSSASQARMVRGVFASVLPGKTRKWRVLKGVRFEWVVEEALGAGEVEVCETGAVGLGIRRRV